LDAESILQYLWEGRITTIPLGVLSIVVLAILLERLWSYRSLDRGARNVARDVVDALVRRDLSSARRVCEHTKNPIGGIFLDGLRWRNIALEDLERVLATSRMEAVTELRRRLWVIGTTGSLAPYIGLFGTVIGIMRAFYQIGITGDTGFEVVSSGISEALIATAVGLLVAIISLFFFNYLQVRVGAIAATYGRTSERFVQALLFVETGGSVDRSGGGGGSEVSHGAVPA
jgi:biopolymer transport protein ExbB